MKYLFIFFTLLLFVSSEITLTCNQGKEYVYEYKSQIDALGQDKIEIVSNFGISCVKQINRKKGSNLLIYSLKMQSLSFQQNGKTKEFPKDVSSFTGFSISTTGKIHKIFHLKKEDSILSSIKKSIISLFQTKLKGLKRRETTQVGTIQFKYNQKTNKLGEIVTEKVAEAKDVLKFSDSRLNTRTAKYTFKGDSLVDTKGVVVEINAHEEIMVGKPSLRRIQRYESLKKGGEKEGPKQPKVVQDSNGSKTQYKIKLVKVQTYTENHKEFINIRKNSVATLEHVESTDLSMSRGTKLAAEKIHRSTLLKQTDFPKLLELLKTSDRSEDMSEAQLFSRQISDVALHQIQKHYKALDFKNKEHVSFAEKLQTLMVATQTKKGQSLFVKTLEQPQLILGGIIKSLSVEKPSADLVSTLQRFSHVQKITDIKGAQENGLLKDLDTIKVTSFMAMASAASRLKHNKELSQKIVLDIASKLSEETEHSKVLTLVHALGNAGEAVPLDSVKNLIHSSNLPLDVRVAAVHGLSTRNSEKSEEEVTELIHTLLDEQNEEAIRVAAVTAQIDRERERSTGTSVEEFKVHLDNPTSTESLRNVLSEYLEEALTLEQMDSVWVQSSKLGLNENFNKIGGICVGSEKTKTNNFCTQDSGAGSYLKEKDSSHKLSNYDSSDFQSTEKISGIQFIHRVDSDISYSGTTKDNLNAIVFERKSRYGHAYGKCLNFLTANALLKKKDGKISNFEVYLKIHNTVMINQNDPRTKADLVDLKAQCHKYSQTLANKVWSPMTNMKFVIMAGPIPATFSVSIAAGLGLGFSALFCQPEKVLSLELSATTNFGVSGSASLSTLIAEIGLVVSSGSGASSKLRIGYSAGRLCHQENVKRQPLSLTISAFGSFSSSSLKTLFKWSPHTPLLKSLKSEPQWNEKSNLEQVAEVNERFKTYKMVVNNSKCYNFETKQIKIEKHPFKTLVSPITHSFDLNFNFEKK